MSDREEPLSSGRALAAGPLEFAGGGDEDDARDPEEYVTREEFEAEIDSLRETVRYLVKQLNLQEQSPQNLTTLQKYTRMVENGDDDPLSPSDRRAVEIHRNWDSLATRFANGRLGITTKKTSTKKHGPAQLRVDLANVLGEDLYREQIYRAMKRTAELSGGSAEPDEYGRIHIVGGTYEYHERTSPDNTDHAKYKVLIRR